MDDFRAELNLLFQAHKQLNESPQNPILEHQIRLFENQLSMLEKLQNNMGNAVFDLCSEEIKEIVELANNCRTSIETNTFESLNEITIRLNILQQRIAGKVMKIKAPTQ